MGSDTAVIPLPPVMQEAKTLEPERAFHFTEMVRDSVLTHVNDEAPYVSICPLELSCERGQRHGNLGVWAGHYLDDPLATVNVRVGGRFLFRLADRHAIVVRHGTGLKTDYEELKVTACEHAKHTVTISEFTTTTPAKKESR